MQTTTKYFGINNPAKFSPSIQEPPGQLYHYMESRNYIGLQKKLVHALCCPSIEDAAWISANYDVLEVIAGSLDLKDLNFIYGIPSDIADTLASKLEWRIKFVIEPILKSEFPDNFNHVEVFGVVPVSYYSESSQEYFLKRYSWLKKQGVSIPSTFVTESYKDLGWC